MTSRTYRPMGLLFLFGFLLLGAGAFVGMRVVGHLFSGQPWVVPSRNDPSGFRVVSGVELTTNTLVSLGLIFNSIYLLIACFINSVELREDRVVIRSRGRVALSAQYTELDTLTVGKTPEDTAGLFIGAGEQNAYVSLLYSNRQKIAEDLVSRAPQLKS